MMPPRSRPNSVEFAEGVQNEDGERCDKKGYGDLEGGRGFRVVVWDVRRGWGLDWGKREEIHDLWGTDKRTDWGT